MKRVLVGLCFIVIAIFLQGCSEPTDEEAYYKIQKTLSNIESYRCTADITVIGNKNKSSYKVKHVFLNPNKYVVEVLEPKENKGNVTLYDGKQAWLYSSNIEQSFLLKDYEQSNEEYLFLGYFLKNLTTTEEAQIASDKIEDEEFIVITVEVPGNSKYRRYEKLWISKKKCIPYRLVILDNSNNISAEVKYSDFKYNLDMDDDQFNIETGIDIIKGI